MDMFLTGQRLPNFSQKDRRITIEIRVSRNCVTAILHNVFTHLMSDFVFELNVHLYCPSIALASTMVNKGEATLVGDLGKMFGGLKGCFKFKDKCPYSIPQLGLNIIIFLQNIPLDLHFFPVTMVG
ncbi:hypothetical protein PHYBLDRAFT_61556 [Phycomyces blakesleeanus NRRL 1555(-)]|uniref:Uncharacterized protein n=1 Tax=Phycomyces blakesleeanus (strain ATCC 8743b / DSM 1359 / FGSC 10004 / NBRC 33097 / NRRL 1555) TaxID=763407 RepID=A0A162YGH2_PHYB8|nr:hypothetical protein PHYBLDRAFT_61556 [Phycomyces blakesleeanus NRRL 1555(-)]OAD80505.1 hypothetical protein PHYBLDRAFT_61556 [Phycomyces blakesleeanus NRRL 1555(-)]|eukprot:XP_018298545.1 hypothetical protein PHYBLDRAFT_61556 [Phycomyces blakesleeanus NRRL 1555(-)]